MIVSIPSSVTLLITELLRDGAHPTLSQERACAQLTHYESSGRNTKTHTEHKNPHPHHGELPPPLAARIFYLHPIRPKCDVGERLCEGVAEAI
jgi:hypothetical protein